VPALNRRSRVVVGARPGGARTAQVQDRVILRPPREEHRPRSPAAGRGSCSRGRGRWPRRRRCAIQALDRTAPILPGVPARATHDYKRAGTSSLYAALDLATRQVIGRLHSRHRAIEFKQLLATIEREVPAHLDVHVVLENSSAHKTPVIRNWLAAHPRLALHFTPTSSSWLTSSSAGLPNSRTRNSRRGAHGSVRDLNADIRAWIKTCNDDPKPYVWTKTADQILESIAIYCTRIRNHDTSCPARGDGDAGEGARPPAAECARRRS
jgi:hypothetical protein